MLVRKLAAGRQVDRLCGSFMAGLAGALGEVQRTAESRGQGTVPQCTATAHALGTEEVDSSMEPRGLPNPASCSQSLTPADIGEENSAIKCAGEMRTVRAPEAGGLSTRGLPGQRDSREGKGHDAPGARRLRPAVPLKAGR